MFRAGLAPTRPRPFPLQAGDLLAFSGTDLLSRIVQLGTFSRFSHVGICARWGDRLLLFESTTLNPEPCAILGRRLDGVQAHCPWQRICAYPGEVWCCRLVSQERLKPDESRRLTDFLAELLGKQYDTPGALLSGTRLLKRRWWASREDLARLFCSELCTAALKHVRRFPLVNASAVNPSELVREAVRIGMYQPAVRLK